MSDAENNVIYPSKWTQIENDTSSIRRKRSFQEKANLNAMDKRKSESRSPTPDLPSRLDQIPSPSYGSDKKSPSKSTGDYKTKERSRSRSIEKKRSRSRSVEKNRRKSESSPKRRRNGRQSSSRSPHRRKRSRSKSRSPRRRRSRSKSRSRSRSPKRRPSHKSRRSRSRSRDKRKRSRSRSRSRNRKRRSRSRSRERKGSKRSPRRRRRSRSRSSSPPRFTSQWGVSRAVLSDKPQKAKEVTTEDVEKRLAEHMKSVQEKAAEEAKKINLPGYLNPAMVNVQQFKQVQDKRKLLWSKPKDKKEGASQWAGAFDDQNSDEKFKRLMGIGGVQIDANSDASKVQESRKVLDELEKEYEKSRAFQMSRGAGGTTGIGLGFGSGIAPQ